MAPVQGIVLQQGSEPVEGQVAPNLSHNIVLGSAAPVNANQY